MRTPRPLNRWRRRRLAREGATARRARIPWWLILLLALVAVGVGLGRTLR